MPIYMQVEGIQGSVTENGHKSWIEIDTFHFGCGRGISNRSPGHISDREASTVSISEISISKEMDETSPSLFALACVGTGKTVKIDCSRTGDKPQIFASYELSNVLVSAYSVDAGGGSVPREKISLNFEKIQFEYFPVSPDGTLGSPSIATYDLSAATMSSSASAPSGNLAPNSASSDSGRKRQKVRV